MILKDGDLNTAYWELVIYISIIIIIIIILLFLLSHFILDLTDPDTPRKKKRNKKKKKKKKKRRVNESTWHDSRCHAIMSSSIPILQYDMSPSVALYTINRLFLLPTSAIDKKKKKGTYRDNSSAIQGNFKDWTIYPFLL